jgi:hypothetical protein
VAADCCIQVENTTYIQTSMGLHHRHLSIIDCLSFVMCPLLAQLIIVFFSFFLLLQSFTVLMKQTRQAVCIIKKSIFRLSISMVTIHSNLMSMVEPRFCQICGENSKFPPIFRRKSEVLRRRR